MITTVAVRDTNDTYQIRSNYVLGCDGAKSQVRKWLDIEGEGEDSCKTPYKKPAITFSYLQLRRNPFQFPAYSLFLHSDTND